MKQGRTEKAVFAKLSKVELGQHEVKLATDLSRAFSQRIS